MPNFSHGPDVVFGARLYAESEEHPTIMECLMDRGSTAILEGVERARSVFDLAPARDEARESVSGIANGETEVCDTKHFSGEMFDSDGYDWF